MTKVIIFDIGGTLIYGKHPFLWTLLHEKYNTTDKAKVHTKNFFSGKITYDDWVFEHFKLITNNGTIPKSHIINTIKSNTTILSNTNETLKKLKEKNYKLVILSGDSNLSLEAHNLTQYFDLILTNKYFESKTENQNEWTYESLKYDMDLKKEGIKYITKQFNCKIEDTIYIGDNENDIIAFNNCGLSIALNPKTKKTEENATKALKTDNLNDILKLLH